MEGALPNRIVSANSGHCVQSAFVDSSRGLTCLLGGGYLANSMSLAASSASAEMPAGLALASAGSERAAEVFPAVNDYFQTLSAALGPMHWWPTRTPFEVIVGAILTQNTSWSNVERAIVNLRRARLLTPHAIERVRRERLERLIQCSGYFRQKTRKLKAFAAFLRENYGGSLARMFRTPTRNLRAQLLGVHGIGPETADSILLYAGGHASFVVDAYTHRILGRHGWPQRKPDYHRVQRLMESSLPRDARAYNEFHALLVHVGKNWCRPREPRCGGCPLLNHLPANSLLRHERASSITEPTLATAEAGCAA